MATEEREMTIAESLAHIVDLRPDDAPEGTRICWPYKTEPDGEITFLRDQTYLEFPDGSRRILHASPRSSGQSIENDRAPGSSSASTQASA